MTCEHVNAISFVELHKGPRMHFLSEVRAKARLFDAAEKNTCNAHVSGGIGLVIVESDHHLKGQFTQRTDNILLETIHGVM